MSLLESALLTHLHREAKFHGNDADKSSAFWQTYLNSKFPLSENYAVLSAQAAPNDNSYIIVRQLRQNQLNIFNSTLIVCEGKQPETGTVEKIENMVTKVAGEYLTSSNESSVYCMTTWGVKARCWMVDKPATGQPCELKPLFGKNKLGLNAAYVDADSGVAAYITAFVAYVKGSGVWPGSTIIQ